MSALLTTTMVYMRTVVQKFKEAGLGDVKLCVGGAPVSPWPAVDPRRRRHALAEQAAHDEVDRQQVRQLVALDLERRRLRQQRPEAVDGQELVEPRVGLVGPRPHADVGVAALVARARARRCARAAPARRPPRRGSSRPVAGGATGVGAIRPAAVDSTIAPVAADDDLAATRDRRGPAPASTRRTACVAGRRRRRRSRGSSPAPSR